MKLLLTMWAASAGPAWAANVELSYVLTGGGEATGSLDIQISDAGEAGVRVRILELQAHLQTPAPSGFRWPWQSRTPVSVYDQQLTSTRVSGGPPSWHSTLSGRRGDVEVQGRRSGAVWRLSVTGAQGPQDRAVRADAVDWTTLDLLDPEVRTPLGGMDEVRVLDADTGDVISGAMVHLGPVEVAVAGTPLWTDGWELRGDVTWRLFYAPGGALVRFERPLQGRAVVAVLNKAPPRASDEFALPDAPHVEVIESVSP